ncbi:MAG: acyltransferase family protein, partial [Candidatus Pacebacteria bacterium]|nr:acyltransferase family protein [Candidatus Paceibacterota bacterium]
LPIGLYVNTLSSLATLGRFWVCFANLFMIGQDTFMFLRVPVEGGSFQFTSNFAFAQFPAYKLLLIPQAWSLGVELWFYLLAPLLAAQRTKVLVLILVISIILRGALIRFLNYSFDPWTYRFFPSELALFVLGMLGCRAYFHFKDVLRPWWGAVAWVVLIGLFFYFPYWGANSLCKHWLFLVLAALTLPFVFNWTKRKAIDRMIGDFSYPLYISHLLVVQVVALRFPAIYRAYPGPIVCLCSLLVSAFLYLCVDKPVDRVRHRMLNVFKTSRCSVEAI